MQHRVAIIGGGAAGFFAAIQHQYHHPKSKVIIYEKSAQVLSKVKISGGGRCNVTHACFDAKQLIDYYPRGGKSLLSAFYQFGPKDTMAFFKRLKVPLKIEADHRVFPCSDSSQSIIDALVHEVKRLGIEISFHKQLTAIIKINNKFQLTWKQTDKQTMVDSLFICSGSNQAMYPMIESLGHKIHEAIPSLFTFKLSDKRLIELAGVSALNARVWIKEHKKEAQSGPLLITHWGISGPSVIRLSSICAKVLKERNYQSHIYIEWLENVDSDDLMKELYQVKAKHTKQILGQSKPIKGLSKRLWYYLMQTANLNIEMPWQHCTHKQIRRFCDTLKCNVYKMSARGIFKEEFVTCGGVCLKEVDLKTMQSKLCEGLYFAGEVLNVDGLTGGFNFQHAWTSGYLAGKNAGEMNE